MSLRVLVVDDEDAFRRAWAKAVAGTATDVDVVEVPNPELLDSLRLLEERRIAARDNAPRPDGELRFDGADVLIIDYDLAPISDFGTLTGEAVSYLARSYSSVRFIILLNAVSESYFDLTLRGETESFADIVLGSRHVGNRGLWSEEVSGFRPWQWPVVPNAVGSFDGFVDYLQEALDLPLLSVLELEAAQLSRSVRSLIEASSAPAAVTVREFVAHGPTGLRRKDILVEDRAVARVAAARLRRWLEFDVISSQDVLVDAPHLISRFPSLLIGSAEDVEAWNEAAHAGDASGLDAERIRRHHYSLSRFLSRDVWYWGALREDKDIPEVAQPFVARPSPFLFCEDVSRFVDPTSTREFVADVAGDYVRRFIVDPDSQGGEVYKEPMNRVELRPMSRLSLR